MTEPSHGELSEDEALEIVLGNHPQWREGYEDGTLPEQIVGEDGEPMSPRMHILIHVIIERQLAADDPAGVAAIAQELADLGVSEHEARHAIGLAVVEQLLDVIQGESTFDEAQYMANLHDLVESHRSGR